MRRSVLWGAGMLFLVLACVRLASPPNVAAASSGKIIYSFTGGADGAYPESDLIVDGAGNLYGTTSAGGTGCGSAGCGTVFELVRTKDGWQHQVLYSFAGGSNDGSDPKTGLVFDGAGNLYGTTSVGGGGGSICFGGCGTVFRLAPNSRGGWTESVLYGFTGSNGDGANPNTDLVFDGRGNLYGTTLGGGVIGKGGGCDVFGCGTVFRLVPNSGGTWTESTIYLFSGAPDGAVPASAVVPGVEGSIYGTTAYGGAGSCIDFARFSPPRGCGTLYKLTPSGGGWTETVIYSFFRGQGFAKILSGGFSLNESGHWFGTSLYGGDGLGAFFQLEQTKKGWEQTILHRFYGGPDGEAPVGRLAVGPQGEFFGVTGGTIFEIERTTRGWKERVLFSFDKNSSGPDAGPTLDSQGHIYGTTVGFGSNYGAVYEVIP
jgi:hypothetical protein